MGPGRARKKFGRAICIGPTRRGLQFGVPARAYQAAVAQMHRLPAASTGVDGPSPPRSWPRLPPGTSSVPADVEKPAQFRRGIIHRGADGQLAGPGVSAVAADPTTPGRLFVGTAGGGVWMTTDGGNTFEPIFDTSRRWRSARSRLIPITTRPRFSSAPARATAGRLVLRSRDFESVDLGRYWTQLGAGEL